MRTRRCGPGRGECLIRVVTTSRRCGVEWTTSMAPESIARRSVMTTRRWSAVGASACRGGMIRSDLFARGREGMGKKTSKRRNVETSKAEGRRDNGTEGRRARPGTGAFVLLEVVLAVALLVVGLTIIGAQVGNATESAYRSEKLSHVMNMVDWKMAQLDTGLIDFESEADNEVEGDFTLRFPDYGWRFRMEETAVEGLMAVTLEILYQPRESLEQKFEPRDAEVVHTVHTLRAIPAEIDLQLDFGLDDEAIEKLSQQMPIQGFNPANFNPAIFQHMSLEELMTAAPALMQAWGMSLEEFAQLVPPEVRAMLELADELGGATDEEEEEAAGGAPVEEPGEGM